MGDLGCVIRTEHADAVRRQCAVGLVCVVELVAFDLLPMRQMLRDWHCQGTMAPLCPWEPSTYIAESGLQSSTRGGWELLGAGWAGAEVVAE
jgi:hypothetical protein